MNCLELLTMIELNDGDYIASDYTEYCKLHGINEEIEEY